MNESTAAAARCKRYRRRILDLSQKVSALHIGGAFSAIEIMDALYNIVAAPSDTILMSKGHGWLAQAVILEERGLLDLSTYCKPDGLGVHPDLAPERGIAAATGSLGHGLGMAVGMALADRTKRIFCVLSDGECMEGSTWEAAAVAADHQLANLAVVVDYNDQVSFDRISAMHPRFAPLGPKFSAFGWLALHADGHNSRELFECLRPVHAQPLAVIARTVKGAGVHQFETEPHWHYRSPTKAEYNAAVQEIENA